MRRRKPSFVKRNMISIIILIVAVLISLVGCSIMSGQGKNSKADEPKKGITAKDVVEAPVKAVPKPKAPAVTKPITTPEQGHDYSILIDKGRFTLYVMDGGKEINHFGVALGLNPGQKHKAGDMTTPTGDFTVEEIDDASYWKHAQDARRSLYEYCKSIMPKFDKKAFRVGKHMTVGYVDYDEKNYREKIKAMEDLMREIGSGQYIFKTE